jgi:hypothetical protein
MFDAPGHDLARLELALQRAAAAIRTAAGPHPVRIGVADRHPDLGGGGDEAYDVANWRSVDGAIEVSLANAQVDQIADVCRRLRPIVAGFADIASVEVMAGPMFAMVPVRRGGTFLSLAFRRDPAITSQQFSDWWLHRHAPMAIPVLGPGLYAYDQVHVDMVVTAQAAAAFGVPAAEYDAYDNLTWDDRYGFLESCSDTAGMAELSQDEIGYIGPGTRRHALMVEVN